MTLTQLGDAYLRYLPFSRELTNRDVAALTKRYLIWSVAGFAINVFLAADGVSSEHISCRQRNFYEVSEGVK